MTALDADLQMKVREIRNEENVRKWMFTDHVIEANEHIGWINRLKQDDRQIVFVVIDDEHTPLGVVSVNAIDRLHKKADWTFYLTEKTRGLGAVLEYSIINFIFDSLGIEKLNSEVIKGNDAVVNLHKKFGFQEEGFRRSNILKNGARIGVHLLGLTREDWFTAKEEFQEKYSAIFKKFSISIQWYADDRQNELHPID